MASRALKIDPKKSAKPTVATPAAANQQQSGRQPVEGELIAVRAYELWCERGCPIGSAEHDWFRAEEELTAKSPR